MSRLVSLSTGIWYWVNPKNGMPLAMASIYVGAAGLDPEIEANRLPVTITQEDGTEVIILPSAQPLLTGAGGVILYEGSAVSVTVDVEVIDSYSIKVLDNTGVQVYYIPSVADLGDDNFVNINGDTMAGQLKQPLAPVDDEDLANKLYVDDVVTVSLLALYPVGSYFLGVDPTSILGGIWEPVPEGTFLMSTIAGSDTSGGTNNKVLSNANMPTHNHGGGKHRHAYWSNWNGTTDGSGNDIGIMGSSGVNGLVKQRQKNESDYESNVVPNDGSSSAFDNRPLYVGIPVFKRTV